MENDTIVLADRFMGPEGSANGGYACGMAAKTVGSAAEVTLRLPPPLNEPLEVRPMTPAGVALVHDGHVVAEAVPTEVGRDIPGPVSFDTAVRASKDYVGFRSHPFMRCFVCGPERAAGDGLRIFPTRCDDRLLAAPWIPDESLADHAGIVGTEFLWAALDCPSGWATVLEPPLEKIVVLGRLTAALHLDVRAGGRYVATSWSIGSSGRKFHAGSALYCATGELCANAWATWIQIGGAPDKDDALTNRTVSDVRR